MSDEVSKNLKIFIENLDSKYLASAMEDACTLVMNDAIRRSPKDTGQLRRSIDFQVSNDGKEGVIYSNAEYAPYVEFGTGIYSSKGNGRQTPWVYKGSHGFVRTKGNKPQPFLEPAVQTNTTNIQDCFRGLF